MIYAVEISYTAMIVADSAEEAMRVAREKSRDIVGDSPDPEPRVLEADVRTPYMLARFGWDDRCIPYGHDGNTTIAEILKEAA